MKRNAIEEAVGWYGTAAILSAYALVSFGFLQASSVPFQALNLTGALGIVYISLKKKAYQPGVLNIAWAIVAIVAIAGLLLSGI
jgi:hypothetical protein